MGIRSKFILLIALLSLLATLVLGYTNYRLSVSRANDEAKIKGEIVFHYIQASSKFFSNYQYPLIMEHFTDKDVFIPELMSKFVVSRMEHEIFEETLEGYQFKNATTDPLWKDNKADQQEEEIIDYFMSNPVAVAKEGQLEKDGEEYFYMAKPIKVTNEFCLTCHGDPLDAPADQRDIYGVENGYNWKMNDTVGMSVVYVSTSKALAGAREEAIKIFSVGFVCLLVTIACIWVFLDRAVVAPIIKLSESAKDISIGKNICDSIHTDCNDEIGELTNSIDRMRISVNKLLKLT